MNDYVKLYVWGAILLCVFAFSFGYAAPYLISAANTELFFLGVFTIAVSPIMIAFIIMKKILPIVRKLKSKE
jgi:hypothetical protein